MFLNNTNRGVKAKPSGASDNGDMVALPSADQETKNVCSF